MIRDISLDKIVDFFAGAFVLTNVTAAVIVAEFFQGAAHFSESSPTTPFFAAQVKAAGKMMMRNVSTRIVNIATAVTAPSSVRWCIPRFGRERASGGRMGDRELRVVGKVARARRMHCTVRTWELRILGGR